MTTDEQEDAAIARAFNMDGAPDADAALVDEYRDVLGQLPDSELAPTPELEERMVAAALARRPAAARTLDAARKKQRSRARMAILGATAVAAAVVVAFMFVGGNSSSGVPTGQIQLSTSQAADVQAILQEPGVRVGTFSNGAGKVALSPAGQGDAYELTATGPVTIGLVSDDGSSSLEPATPVDGVIGFGVDHPDRVTAITLSQNGRQIAIAELP
jgi:hypothetical protein